MTVFMLLPIVFIIMIILLKVGLVGRICFYIVLLPIGSKTALCFIGSSSELSVIVVNSHICVLYWQIVGHL